MPAPDPLLERLNHRIEAAVLNAEATEDSVRQLCAEARDFYLHAVVVNPVWVPFAAEHVVDTKVQVISVVGYPLGANRTDIKVAEAVEAVADGAREIDLVANIGWLVADRFTDVEVEIRKVRRQIPDDITLKVIIEAGKLGSNQLRPATQAVINGGADFVKTSTGFFGGATVDQVKALFEAAAGRIQVKASGGIRSVEDCRGLIGAGASRLGTSSAAAIMRQYKKLYGAAGEVRE